MVSDVTYRVLRAAFRAGSEHIVQRHDRGFSTPARQSWAAFSACAPEVRAPRAFPLDAPAHPVKTARMSSATLTIDLDAIAANWRALDAMTGTETAAVVKADAYGLGVDRVARTLARAGARGTSRRSG